MENNIVDYLFLIAGIIGLLTSNFFARITTNSYRKVDKNSEQYRKALKSFRIGIYAVSIYLLIIGLIGLLKH